MKPFLDTTDEFTALNDQLKEKVVSLISSLDVEKRICVLRANSDIANSSELADSLVVLVEGNLIYQQSKKRIFSYEPGDLVGVERLFRPTNSANIISNKPVTVEVYPADKFFPFLIKNPSLLDTWSEILILKLEIYASIISSLAELKIRDVEPKEFTVPAGEKITKEGQKGTEVYCILEGSADVSINGNKVGEIKEDEVFGVLAALGDVPRTATVTAKSDCRIMVVDKVDFAELVKAKPAAFEKVMQDTARAINDLNQKVSALDKNRLDLP